MSNDNKTIDPNYLEVGAFFNGSSVYTVPKYQRGYSWEKQELDDFCSDLFDCLSKYKSGQDYEHFFGGLVCIREKRESVSQTYKVFSVVDGQQRMSTFAIFISVLVGKLNQIQESIDEEKKKGVEKLVERIEERYLYYTESVNLVQMRTEKVVLSKKDQSYFKYLVYGGDELEEETNSHKRLKFAKKYIEERLNEEMTDLSFIECVSFIENIDSVLCSKCHVLRITTEEKDDAYRLFQVLNDRGRALSASDLLRASSLGLFDENTESKIQDQASLIWDDLTADKESDVEKYLSYFYVSQTGEKLKKLELFEKFHQLFFKDRNGTEIYSLLKKIKDSFEQLKDLEKGIWPYENSTASDWERQKLRFVILTFKHTECLPLLLVASQLKEKKFVEVVQVIENFFFRYKTMLKKRFDPATQKYLDSIKLINLNGDKYAPQQLKKELRGLIALKTTDEEFIASITSLRYSKKEQKDSINGNRLIKYLLIQLEENWNWIESGCEGGASKRNSLIDQSSPYDFGYVSIEHICSQSQKGSGSDIEEYIDRIENLTLLDRLKNSKLGNKGFEIKKQHFVTTGYNLNKDLSKYEKWDKESLECRLNKILESVVPLFSF